ncbi:DUF1837 domain-containing protein [Ornithinibacillus sp. BX22]|uniref:DUF1837 domain-containing protein n=1 Tax=Ornithinibacillus hominis TaxID=2763055 RepID=A0A923RLU5_9BACI|nr:DUF1837 domain-containing protein [Ornithinibacillus hominis]MBC5638452.1 DUF1837 domain-containing protein [Ornithinibacillus hominis]
MKHLTMRAKNLIYKFEVSHPYLKTEKTGMTLDYEDGKYRQSELVRIIRDTVVHFALTKREIQKYKENDDFGEMQRKAWERISKAHKNSKGDYGELLLFIILSIFFPSEKFVTKVRLRSSMKDQIKGFDCAHFSIENDEVILWLGEAKFHKQFSGAITDAISSVNEHCNINYLKDEISILASNIEINETFQAYEKINNVLNGGISLDKIKIRIPVLLTYDCNLIPKHTNIEDAKFVDEMGKEFISKYQNIDNHMLTLKPNIEVLFIILPFESVSNIKSEIEILEAAMR